MFNFSLCPGSTKEMQPEWPSERHLKRSKLRKNKGCDFELSPCNSLSVTLFQSLHASLKAFFSVYVGETTKVLRINVWLIKFVTATSTSEATWKWGFIPSEFYSGNFTRMGR